MLHQKQEESCDVQRIKLEPEQASKVPFPPGCPVVVFEKSNILCSGEVNAVFVSFSHDSGSCDNCYEVYISDVKGSKLTLVARGDQLRYGIDCPIFITPQIGSGVSANESIEGVIKGFEVQPDCDSNVDSSKCKDSQAFLYTVEVSAAVGDDQERLYRQRGIGPENIRFRHVSKATSYLQDERTSIVSFDDVSSSQGKNEPRFFPRNEVDIQNERGPFSTIEDPFVNPCNHPCSPSPRFRPPMLNEFHSPKASCFPTRPSTSPLSSSPKRFDHCYPKCMPLGSPIPNHFQGDMEESKQKKVPEFSFLVNFPNNSKNDVPPGKRRCVMCGEVRFANSGSSRGKGKGQDQNSIFIPNQNKGLCTHCDVSIWVVNESKMQIKWCKGCKNFQCWAAFGEKGSATKCMRCRDRQREKYAMSKGLKGGEKNGSGNAKRKSTDSAAIVPLKKRSNNE